MADSATNDEIIAFRLRAHHLDERLSHNSLLDAAGACGIQNSPPGSALTALHARGADRTPCAGRRPHPTTAKATGPDPSCCAVDCSAINRRLSMAIAPFGTVRTSMKSALTAEAEAIGALRESDAVDIEFPSD